LWGLKGLRLDVSESWRSGENLSAHDIGNTFIVFQIFRGETVRLYGLPLGVARKALHTQEGFLNMH
jgi:hypothetical protein